ncbi:MAG: hypothetical protein WCQ59_08845, partial [Candidatus Cloacimonadaceae bacterium]
SWQNISQPGFKVDCVVFAGGHQAVDNRCHFAAIFIADKQPVFPSQCPGADGIFRRLCSYEHNRPYAQDIFILIFFQDALKNSFFPVKAMDKN